MLSVILIFVSNPLMFNTTLYWIMPPCLYVHKSCLKLLFLSSPLLPTGQIAVVTCGQMSVPAWREGLSYGAGILPVPAPHATLHRKVTPSKLPAHQRSPRQPAGQGDAQSAGYWSVLWHEGNLKSLGGFWGYGMVDLVLFLVIMALSKL